MRAASAQAAPASFRLRQQKGGASRAALAAPRSRPSRGAATRLRAVSQAPADTLEATADKASSAEVVVAPAPEKKARRAAHGYSQTNTHFACHPRFPGRAGGLAGSSRRISQPSLALQVEWWEKHHARNMVTVTTARGLRRVLQRVRPAAVRL